MKLQHPKPHKSVRRAVRSWASPLAIALVMIIGLETAATAAFSSLEEHTVVYNGKCPGDRDDDCRD
ncbi:hypothetical protein IQE94_05895 [Synechocystis sp. PCC 7339]|uniref:hypothetical protein n=1 Tax=Synechocystis TaxID=1142 RepID=UPI00188219B5|nr:MULTISPECIES: hypothetical protein [Synechocystis]MBE9204028.1 hypothetical protein [Synechocystis salina LEGE 06099]QUS61605.1 hypothetical protein HTZ78_13695 [Synechocystis sp. PCC 7338]UAJ73802.1 hypothetical protein IQE94_05895 [Synechocystis sp. PCC 7339]